VDKERLDALVKHKDAVNAEIQRVKGRREAALEAQEALRVKCRARNVEPDQLEATIEALRARYEAMLAAAEREVAEAQERLAPYLEAVR